MKDFQSKLNELLNLTAVLEQEESKCYDQVSASPASLVGEDLFFDCMNSNTSLKARISSIKKKEKFADEKNPSPQEPELPPFEETGIVDARRSEEIVALARNLQLMS